MDNTMFEGFFDGEYDLIIDSCALNVYDEQIQGEGDNGSQMFDTSNSRGEATPTALETPSSDRSRSFPTPPRTDLMTNESV